MSNIDNGVMGLIGGHPPVVKGKAGDGNAEGKSLARSSEFSEAYASVAGKSGEQPGHRFKARGVDDAGEGDDKDGATSLDRLRLSRFATGERPLSNARSIALEGNPATVRGDSSTPETGAIAQLRDAVSEDADGVPDKVGQTDTVGPQIAASKTARKDTDTDPAGDEASTEDAGTASPEKGDVDVILSLLAGADHGPTIALATAQGEAGTKATGKTNTADRRKDGNGPATAIDRASHLAAGEAEPGAEMADVDVDGSDADQVFRLIRADGKGREVELSIGRGADPAATKDAAAQPAKVETVTVLDARRYLGLAEVGNSAAVTAAITQDPEWASSLTSSSALHGGESAATGKVVNTLKIQMQPIDLGMVTATLRLSGEDLVVDLQVETGEAYRQLSDDKDQIVKALRGHGFTVDQVNVQLSSVDRSAATGQGSAHTPSGGQQQAHEGGNGRQGGGQQGAGDWTGFATGEGLGNEQISSGNGMAGVQPGRSGGVYL